MKSKQKILIIEDDESLQKVLVEWLKSDGYEVASASTGEEGLNQAKSQVPNLILLDLLLPEMNGFEVMKKMNKDAVTKKIPVIVLTNLGTDQNAEIAMKLGAKAYLVKAHYRLADVIQVIKKILKENK